MRKLRILFIIAGMVGAFYLNGAGNRVQASPGAAIQCYGYAYPTSAGCAEAGQNCENGGGSWCEACTSGGVTTLYCIYW